MRLRAEDLAARLKQSGLSPIYFISGDEPLQIMECADAVRQHAVQEHFEERIVFDVDKGFDWNTLLHATGNISLFSTRRLLELRMGNQKPGKEGAAVLTEYTQQLPPDTVLVITSGRLDRQTQQSKWYGVLEKSAVCIQVKEISAADLPEWIRRRVQKSGKNTSLQAAALLADRVEGNLLAAKQEIDKLCLLAEGGVITEDNVIAAVADSARFGVFGMIEAAFAGDTARTTRMLAGLLEEGLDPAEIYPALMWEFRRLCSMAFAVTSGISLEKLYAEYRVWDQKRKQGIKLTLRRHTLQQLHVLFRFALRIERVIKSSDKPLAVDQLQALLLKLAGGPATTGPAMTYDFAA